MPTPPPKPGGGNTPKAVPVVGQWRAPMLSEAINSLELKDPNPPLGVTSRAALTADHLKTILSHVWKRLSGTLDDVWNTSEGKGDPANATNVPKDDEAWARQVSEMMLCNPYGGPGQSYTRLSGESDRYLYRRMQDGHGFPIVTACQHICDVATLLRGYTWPEDTLKFKSKQGDWTLPSLKVQYDAADASPAAKLRRRGETSDPPDAERGYVCGPDGEMKPPPRPGTRQDIKCKTPSREVSDAFDRGMTVGTVFAFKQPRHAGIALRVDAQRKLVQWFDTGALGAPPATGAEPPVVLFHKMKNPWGIQDFNWLGAACNGPTGSGSNKFYGYGIPPVAKDVPGATTFAKTLRPWGMARLKLTWRQTGEVLWVSPLLLMYTNASGDEGGVSGTHNLYYSKYAWSLRHLPGRDVIDAQWIFYIPLRPFGARGETAGLCGAMLTAGRTSPLRELLFLAKVTPAPTKAVRLEDADGNIKKSEVRRNVLLTGRDIKCVLVLGLSEDFDANKKRIKGSFTNGQVTTLRKRSATICMKCKIPDGKGGLKDAESVTIDLMLPTKEKDWKDAAPKFDNEANKWQQFYEADVAWETEFPWNLPSGALATSLAADELTGALAYFRGDWTGEDPTTPQPTAPPSGPPGGPPAGPPSTPKK